MYMYVLNFNDRVFFAYCICIFYHMIIIMIVLCAVLFSANIILMTTLDISVRRCALMCYP